MLTLPSSNEETEIRTQKERMIGEASQNGLSTDGAQELKALVDQYPDILRLSLGPVPPQALRAGPTSVPQAFRERACCCRPRVSKS
jgi:hypothetical protein